MGKIRGVISILRGFWHAHSGWLFDPEPPDLERYIQDLNRSRALRVASALFPLWVALGLLIPAALGGLITGSWAGVWTVLIWGGLVRIFLVHHVTWSVNSACHLWGSRPFQSNDESRNNAVFGILAMGEGWHNTHHAFSDLRPSWTAMVAARRQLLAHLVARPPGTRVGLETSNPAGTAPPAKNHLNDVAAPRLSTVLIITQRMATRGIAGPPRPF